MNVELIRGLYNDHRWANRQLFDAPAGPGEGRPLLEEARGHAPMNLLAAGGLLLLLAGPAQAQQAEQRDMRLVGQAQLSLPAAKPPSAVLRYFLMSFAH